MTSPTLIREERVILEVETPRVAVGESHDFRGRFYTFDGEEITFRALVIQQVEIDAPSLAVGDDVTLDLYRSNTRDNHDLMTRLTGASQLTDAWKAIFADQASEYFDRQRENNIYGRVTSTAGNSAASIFHIVIIARRVF